MFEQKKKNGINLDFIKIFKNLVINNRQESEKLPVTPVRG